jgi:hypothetical protein
LPELRDVASDQQAGGATLTLTIDRDQAARSPGSRTSENLELKGLRRPVAAFNVTELI